MSIWDHSKTRADAERAWLTWQANVSPELRSNFKALITAMTNWHNEILDYFESSMTSAYTESSNNLTRTANRTGRGYSFDVIRARMLYNNVALKQGLGVIQKPASDKPKGKLHAHGRTAPPRTRYTREVVAYGAYIPTLAKLADEGFFD